MWSNHKVIKSAPSFSSPHYPGEHSMGDVNTTFTSWSLVWPGRGCNTPRYLISHLMYCLECHSSAIYILWNLPFDGVQCFLSILRISDCIIHWQLFYQAVASQEPEEYSDEVNKSLQSTFNCGQWFLLQSRCAWGRSFVISSHTIAWNFYVQCWTYRTICTRNNIHPDFQFCLRYSRYQNNL